MERVQRGANTRLHSRGEVLASCLRLCLGSDTPTRVGSSRSSIVGPNYRSSLIFNKNQAWGRLAAAPGVDRSFSYWCSRPPSQAGCRLGFTDCHQPRRVRRRPKRRRPLPRPARYPSFEPSRLPFLYAQMPAAMAMAAKNSDSITILLTADSGSRAVGRRDGHAHRLRDHGHRRAR